MATASVAVRPNENVTGYVTKTRKMLINGKWVDAASGKTFKTYNPATGEVLSHVAEGDKEDIDRAVKAARAAFETGPWSKISPSERGRMIWRLGDLLEKHLEEFAQLESLDNGKPLKIARVADLPLSIDHFRYYAGWATKIEGNTVPMSGWKQGMFHAYTMREPVGVVGQIIPWNFPLLMAAWKLGPALATGCTIVLKPAEQTPLTALRLGELIQEAGIPDGVVNIVTGFGPGAGSSIAEHPDIDKVAFTGSTEVGKLILRASAGNLKRVSLELGGKSPNIIFRDSDLDAAVQSATRGVFFNSGQVCTAGTRIFIEQGIYEEFVERLVKHSESMTLGDPLHESTRMGPVVSKEQFDRVRNYLDIGKSEGATVATGGDVVSGAGYYVRPTIFAGVHNQMRIAREEIFGPVGAAIPFKDEADAVFQGNDTNYGLAAAVWTRDVSRGLKVARALKAGTVWINTYGGADPISPFGGYKQSGFGRELGMHSLELYTQVKSVYVK